MNKAYIEANCHFVRENVQQKNKIYINIICKKWNQQANVFTRELHPRSFEDITSKLELIDIYTPN